MSVRRWVLIIALVIFFVVAKTWVLAHPKGTAAVVIGAFLLILTEPAEAK